MLLACAVGADQQCLWPRPPAGRAHLLLARLATLLERIFRLSCGLLNLGLRLAYLAAALSAYRLRAGVTLHRSEIKPGRAGRRGGAAAMIRSCDGDLKRLQPVQPRLRRRRGCRFQGWTRSAGACVNYVPECSTYEYMYYSDCSSRRYLSGGWSARESAIGCGLLYLY